MKISSQIRSHRTQAAYQGFTLIELLVVISIIAVLAGLLFPAMGAVRNMARKTSAKNDVTQIVNAVKSYYTEYGRYPFSGTTAPTSITTVGGGKKGAGQSNQGLMQVLTLYNASGTAVTDNNNPRKIRFLEVPKAKDTTNPRSGSGTDGWYDPWGQTYGIRIDYTYSGSVGTFSFSCGKKGTHSASNVPTEVVAYSLGNPDNDSATGDPVLSWQ